MITVGKIKYFCGKDHDVSELPCSECERIGGLIVEERKQTEARIKADVRELVNNVDNLIAFIDSMEKATLSMGGSLNATGHYLKEHTKALLEKYKEQPDA
jgi:hypothetical protein